VVLTLFIVPASYFILYRRKEPVIKQDINPPKAISP
jgi:hypothetical protein